jgi:nucleotide-binding universal stress UspA family protein
VEALAITGEFIKSMNEQGATIELMHVGRTAPVIRRDVDGTIVPVILRTGDVVSAILQEADSQQIDLIVMPTAGHHGFLDAVRGSTTERVLRHAPCPLLAVPAR